MNLAQRGLTLSVLALIPLIYAGTNPAHAQEEPAPHTQRYRFDPETSFLIVGSPGVPTDLQLAPEEHVTGFALGDTVQWVIEELPGHVFVKPMKSDINTAGTLVTDRHSYQLIFRSAHPKESWMQRVLWTYPDLVIFRAPQSAPPHGAERIPAIPINDSPKVSTAGLDPTAWNFQYSIEGEASFRPLNVMDDQKSIWIHLKSKESMPAVFEGNSEAAKLMNYSLRGDWILIPKLASEITLKLGRQEVHIHRLGP